MEIEDIKNVMKCIVDNSQQELFACSKDELEKYWHYKPKEDMSEEQRLYNFYKMLKLYASFCRRWEEHHNGSCCVVERVRDNYIMPKIREYLQFIDGELTKEQWEEIYALQEAMTGNKITAKEKKENARWCPKQKTYLEKLGERIKKSSKLVTSFTVILEMHPYGEMCHELHLFVLGHRVATLSAYDTFKTPTPKRITIFGEPSINLQRKISRYKGLKGALATKEMKAIEVPSRTFNVLVAKLEKRILNLINDLGQEMVEIGKLEAK